MNLRVNITSLQARPQLWRVKHDWELGELWRENVPEVFRMFPLHGIPLNREWQLYSYALNPGMSPQKWRVLYDYRRAFTNHGAGYDYPARQEEKQDWVNRRDLRASDLPRFDQPRVCGGAIVAGVREADVVWIDTLNVNNPPPTIENTKPWHKFCALNVGTKVQGELVTPSFSKFPQNDGRDCWIPLISQRPVYMSLSNLQKWDWEELPDPYKIYT